MNIKKTALGLLSFICLLLFTSCARVIKPETPDLETDLREYPRSISTFNLPLEISIDELEKLINQQVTGVIYNDNSYTNNDNDDILLKVVKDGNIDITAEDNMVYYQVPIDIWASYGPTLQQETEMKLVIKFKTRIDINTKWQLKTKTELIGYRWIKKPSITVMWVKIPMTTIVEGILDNELPAITEILDNEVKDSFDSRKMIKEAWSSLQDPYLVNEDYRLFLVVEPKEFYITPIKGNSRKIMFNVGVKGFIELKTEDVLTETEKKALSDLIITSKKYSGFNISVAQQISFEKATEMLKENLVGYRYETGNKYTEITDVELFGVGEELGMKVVLDGKVKGHFYMKGMPAYDSLSQELYMDNFDFDVKSRKLLLSTASWLLKGPLRKKIQKNMRFSIGEYIDEYTSLVQESLDENTIVNNVKMKCDIHGVNIIDILMTENSIMAKLNVAGNAKLLMSEIK